MSDFELAQEFRRRRRVTRWCMFASVFVLLVAWRLDPPGRFIAGAVGVALFVAVFVLYFRWCNRCPRCRTSFSKAPEYASDETGGLPLLNSIASCPFCKLDLDGGGTTDRGSASVL